MNIWQILEIEPTTDIKQIKLAYSTGIKKYKPETHPNEFQQLRQAYEIAQKYAEGLDVNCELYDADLKNVSDEADVYSNPVDAANYLLDILYQDQNEAAKLLQDMQKTGKLDNLNYSEQFQKMLAINLLTATPDYLYFICYLIDFFDWFETSKNGTPDAYYNIALRNLINQTSPYRFIQHMEYISRISKKDAKEKKLDWYECCSAKILMTPKAIIKFYFVVFFRRKVVKAILSHLDIINDCYPQAMGLGFDIPSWFWWRSYKYNGGVIRKLSARIYVLLLLLSFFIAHISN